MVASSIKRIIIVFIAIKTFFRVIYDFVKWFFTRNFVIYLIISTFIAIIIWGLGFYYYIDNIKQSWNEIEETTPKFKEKTDAIIVLTGGSERLKHGFHLLRKGGGNKMFISGVNKDVKKPELFKLYNFNNKFISKFGKKVELGYSAADTIENAQEISGWVRKNNFKSIRVVTSNYHIKRALLEIEHRLPDVIIVPHPVVPVNIRIDKWWEFPGTRKLLIMEYNKYLFVNLRIFVEKLGF